MSDIVSEEEFSPRQIREQPRKLHRNNDYESPITRIEGKVSSRKVNADLKNCTFANKEFFENDGSFKSGVSKNKLPISSVAAPNRGSGELSPLKILTGSLDDSKEVSITYEFSPNSNILYLPKVNMEGGDAPTT